MHYYRIDIDCIKCDVIQLNNSDRLLARKWTIEKSEKINNYDEKEN